MRQGLVVVRPGPWLFWDVSVLAEQPRHVAPAFGPDLLHAATVTSAQVAGDDGARGRQPRTKPGPSRSRASTHDGVGRGRLELSFDRSARIPPN